MPKNEAKAPSFEEQLTQLEALVAQMETGDMSLEALMDAYQRGMAISAALQARLEQAQAELTEIGAGKPPAKRRKAAEPPVAEQTSLLDE